MKISGTKRKIERKKYIRLNMCQFYSINKFLCFCMDAWFTGFSIETKNMKKNKIKKILSTEWIAIFSYFIVSIHSKMHTYILHTHIWCYKFNVWITSERYKNIFSRQKKGKTKIIYTILSLHFYMNFIIFFRFQFQLNMVENRLKLPTIPTEWSEKRKILWK